MSSGHANFNATISISHCYWHLVVKNDIHWSISHCYWHLVVNNGNFNCYWHPFIKNGNFTLLLMSNGQECQFQFHIATLTYSGQECQFHIASGLTSSGHFTRMSTMAISHCIHQECNFTLLLMSNGQECQFHIATDIKWYGNITLLLTSSGQECQFHIATDMSSGQECQFHIATDIQWPRMTISHCYWHLMVINGNLTLLLTSRGQECQFQIATDV